MNRSSTSTRRKPPQTTPPRPPRLQRSQSASTSNDQTPISRSDSIKKSPSRTKIPPRASQNNPNEKEAAKLMQRSTSLVVQRETRSCPSSPRNSPSWPPKSQSRVSLSPSRPVSRDKEGATVKGSTGVGQNRGFLKYFKGKKVSQKEEEEHRFRVLHSRLVQWRYVNARAEAKMNSAKKVAERKMFRVWITIAKMRNSILESRLQEKKIKHAIKLHRTIYGYTDFCNEWSKLEKRNSEAFNRLAKKLLALSVRVPLLEGAEADEKSLNEAIMEAIELINGIDNVTTKFLAKVENICHLISEIIVVLKQEEECLKELKKYLPYTNN